MNRGLSKAYFLWKTKGEDQKKIEYVCTRDGQEITRADWNKLAYAEIKANHKEPLLKEIEKYVSVSCPYVKAKNVKEFSMDCLLRGTYKKWSDFKVKEVYA